MDTKIKLHGVIHLFGHWTFVVDVKKAFKFSEGDSMTLLDRDGNELSQIRILGQRHGVSIDSIGICFEPLSSTAMLQDADYILP